MATTITAGNATNGAAISSDNTGILELKTGTGSGTTAMTVGTDQAVTFAQSANLPNTFGFKNRIINGAMVIDQRNAGAAVTTTNSYPVDRFIVGNSTDGAFSGQQVTDAPAGFINSVKITITTADASLTGTQSLSLLQRIEGTNVSDLAWGTASAKTVTLSFWVKSSLTGTFGGSLRNSTPDRSYPFTYTISSANTWEQKTVTIAGDTTGTWLTTTGTGITVTFSLGAGPDRSGTAGVWNSNNNNSATGATSVIGTLNATWYITGVQLEKGSTATSFDYRPYSTELQLAQRYYWKITTFPLNVAATTQFCGSNIKFPVTMRAAPTLSNATFTMGTGNAGTATTLGTTVEGCGIYNSANNWTVGALCQVSCDFTGAEL